MIGNELMKKPDTCTEISKIFQSVGFDESRLEGSIGFIKYIAEKFADLNNEVYYKLHAEEDKIFNVCFYNRDDMGSWTYECRKDKSKCPVGCRNNKPLSD